LVDIAMHAPPDAKIVEIPYVFRARHQGASKLDGKTLFEFAAFVLSRLTGGILPFKFVSYCLVGALGVVVLVSVVWLALAAGLSFGVAQLIGTFVAMTSNFFVNNEITYRDRRLSGWRAIGGVGLFYVICSVGVVGNVGIALLVFAERPVWWMAAIAGAL